MWPRFTPAKRQAPFRHVRRKLFAASPSFTLPQSLPRRNQTRTNSKRNRGSLATFSSTYETLIRAQAITCTETMIHNSVIHGHHVPMRSQLHVQAVINGTNDKRAVNYGHVAHLSYARGNIKYINK